MNQVRKSIHLKTLNYIKFNPMVQLSIYLREVDFLCLLEGDAFFAEGGAETGVLPRSDAAEAVEEALEDVAFTGFLALKKNIGVKVPVSPPFRNPLAPAIKCPWMVVVPFGTSPIGSANRSQKLVNPIPMGEA